MELESLKRIDQANGVSILVLNRPSSLNAFDASLYSGVTKALTEAAADEAISCVVIAGEGADFSAGVDRSELELATSGPEGREEALGRFRQFVSTLAEFPKPLIAAVEGSAVGVGVTLLGHCDLVIAGRSARFRTPFTKLGLVPEAGSSFTLPMRLGQQGAAFMLLTSDWLRAQDAMGLVWRVVDDGTALSAALDLASQMAEVNVESLTETKRLLRAPYEDAVTAALRREDIALEQVLRSSSSDA